MVLNGLKERKLSQQQDPLGRTGKIGLLIGLTGQLNKYLIE